MVKDVFGRSINYLRLSLTDRCNLRCQYCMPEEGLSSLSHFDILRYEEFEQIVRVAAYLGVEQIRLTGGEPLVRKGLVAFISSLRQIPGLKDISLTTNGQLLVSQAKELQKAGLNRVNISLDTLDSEQFRKLTRCGELEQTLQGIDEALALGLHPVKLNVVTIRSLQQDYRAFALMTKDKPLHVRFIEYMPIGQVADSSIAKWDESDIVSSQEVLDTINAAQQKAGAQLLNPLAREKQVKGYGPARYYAFPGALGSVGFISAWSNHFCSECNRMRVTADGKLRPCLFSDEEIDLKTILRSGEPEDEIFSGLVQAFNQALAKKPDAHHNRVGTKRIMSQIGG